MNGDKWEPAWGGIRPDITGEVPSINLDAITIFAQKTYSSIILKYLNNIVWFFSDSFLVSKCCDLLLELVNLRVLPKTHKVQKSKGNDRIIKKFLVNIIYGMIWMWLKFGDDRVTSKKLGTRPDPHPPPQTSTHLSPFILSIYPGMHRSKWWFPPKIDLSIYPSICCIHAVVDDDCISVVLGLQLV